MKSSGIQIHLLGNFEMIIDGNAAMPQLKQSKKISHLVEYLLLNYGTAVSHEELIDTLWNDREGTNPEAALRTLLHRYRQLAQQSGNEELADLIVSTRGFMQINPDIDCEIDIIEAEKLCGKAKDSSTPVHEKIALLSKATDMYRGPLLTDSANEFWVVPKSAYYHERFMECVLFLVELLKQQEEYEQIIQLCRRVLTVNIYDDRLHIELMLALIKTGKKREALSQYQFTTDLYYQQLGTQPSENIRNLYKVIIHADQSMEKDIEKIQEAIEHEDGSNCAFVCEYEIFKEIYHLQRRMLERYSSTIFLGLITLAPVYGQRIDPLVLDRAMKQLLDILRYNLRRGDAVSRFSTMQYVTLLPSVTYDTGKQVMERIKQKYYRENVNSSMIITYKLHPLCVDRFYSGGAQKNDKK